MLLKQPPRLGNRNLPATYKELHRLYPPHSGKIKLCKDKNFLFKNYPTQALKYVEFHLNKSVNNFL